MSSSTIYNVRFSFGLVVLLWQSSLVHIHTPMLLASIAAGQVDAGKVASVAQF